MKKQLSLLMCFVVLLLSISLWGCGVSDDESTTAPSDSTIVINPSGVSYEVADLAWHTDYLTIVVYDASGKPMNNVDINISFVWANPDVEGLVQLYDGTTPVTSPFVATTDENGVYNLMFGFFAPGAEYGGTFEVRSGAAFGSADFEITLPKAEE